MKRYEEEEYYNEQLKTQKPAWSAHEQEVGCGFCWDKRRKNDKELFFLDAANNMRICTYCPSCGRKY